MITRKPISVRRAAIQDVVDWCIDHLAEFDKEQLVQLSFLSESELLDRELGDAFNEKSK